MTPEELNAKAATDVMGWERKESAVDDYWHDKSESEICNFEDWSPSTDANDALMCFERVREMCEGVMLDITTIQNDTRYWVAVYTGQSDVDCFRDIFSHGDTFPEAVTLACVAFMEKRNA